MRSGDIEVSCLPSGSDFALAVLTHVIGNPEVWRDLPLSMRGERGIDSLLDSVRSGRLYLFPAVTGGELAALYMASPFDGGGLFVHQYVLPDFRRMSVALSREALGMAFACFPCVHHLVGLVPVSMRHSALVAVMSGFERRGVWPAWYARPDGTREDCVCLILQREKFYGRP